MALSRHSLIVLSFVIGTFFFAVQSFPVHKRYVGSSDEILELRRLLKVVGTAMVSISVKTVKN